MEGGGHHGSGQGHFHDASSAQQPTNKPSSTWYQFVCKGVSPCSTSARPLEGIDRVRWHLLGILESLQVFILPDILLPPALFQFKKKSHVNVSCCNSAGAEVG